MKGFRQALRSLAVLAAALAGVAALAAWGISALAPSHPAARDLAVLLSAGKAILGRIRAVAPGAGKLAAAAAALSAACWLGWHAWRERLERGLARRLVYFQVSVPQDWGAVRPGAAVEFLRSLGGYGFLRGPQERLLRGQPCFRFVLRRDPPDGAISIYFGAPADRAEGFLNAFRQAYPGAELVPAPEPPTASLPPAGWRGVRAVELWPARPGLPLRFHDGGPPDPLDAVAMALGAGRQGPDVTAVDVLFRPVPHRALARPALAELRRLRGEPGRGQAAGPWEPAFWREVALVLAESLAGRRPGQAGGTRPAGPLDAALLEALERRLDPAERVFRAQIRLLVCSPGAGWAAARVQSALAGFGALAGPVNALAPAPEPIWSVREGAMTRSFAASASELASLAHVPSGGSAAFPHLARPPARAVRVPSGFPSEGVLIGRSNFPGEEDRRVALPLPLLMRHVFVAGKTGMGKTTGLLTMMLSILDMHKAGAPNAPGFAFLDPHGDGVYKLLGHVPEGMEDKVHVIPTGQTPRPRGFNFLEVEAAHEAERVASEFVATLRALFPGQTGPRMDHFLRNGLLTLLKAPPKTILDLQPLFSDEDYRERVLDQMRRRAPDPLLERFWETEFADAQSKMGEILGPILNKIGALTSYRGLRLLFGQERSTVNLRRAMDRGEIVLVDGSGCGPDELKLLLGLFVVRFHFAALSRADTPPGARRPFLLFCDEVHNYAVPTIEKILAEDRKYGLGLVLATQYLEQMPHDVLGAIMGNVNTVWLLQLGAPSAQAMARWLKPDFTEHDLSNQPQFCAAVRTVGPDGSSVSFTVRCDPIGDGDERVRRRVLAASDARDGRDAAEVEAEVDARLSGQEIGSSRVGHRRRRDEEVGGGGL